MKLGMDIVFEQQKDFLFRLQHAIFLIQDSSGYFQIILVYSFAHNGFSVIFNDNVDLYKMAWKLASKMDIHSIRGKSRKHQNCKQTAKNERRISNNFF